MMALILFRYHLPPDRVKDGTWLVTPILPQLTGMLYPDGQNLPK